MAIICPGPLPSMGHKNPASPLLLPHLREALLDRSCPHSPGIQEHIGLEPQPTDSWGCSPVGFYRWILKFSTNRSSLNREPHRPERNQDCLNVRILSSVFQKSPSLLFLASVPAAVEWGNQGRLGDSQKPLQFSGFGVLHESLSTLFADWNHWRN